MARHPLPAWAPWGTRPVPVPFCQGGCKGTELWVGRRQSLEGSG